MNDNQNAINNKCNTHNKFITKMKIDTTLQCPLCQRINTGRFCTMGEYDTSTPERERDRWTFVCVKGCDAFIVFGLKTEEWTARAQLSIHTAPNPR